MGAADFRRTCAALVLATGFAVAPPARAADDWEFAIAPYLLAPSINGEAGLGRFIDGADVDVDSRDIFEHLDLGAMIHAEVRHRSGFGAIVDRSEEHTSELQSLMRSSYAVFCLKKKKQTTKE